MKRLVVVACMILFTSTTYGAPQDKKNAARDQLASTLDRQFTAGAGIASDVLQAVGQAVLKKAIRAGWAELASKLSTLAGCGSTPPPLPSTCDVLGHARIEDLIASPKILLEAFVADLMATLRKELDKVPNDIKAPVGGLIGAWIVFGQDSAATYLKPWLKTQITAHAAEVQCPSNQAAAVAWLLGECIANDPNATVAMADLPSCKFHDLVSTCTFEADPAKNAADQDQVVQVAELASKALSTTCDKRCLARQWVQVFFEWTKLAYPEAKALLDGFEQLFLGLIDRDWTRTVVGIGHVAAAVNTKDCDDDKHKCTIEMKLVRIVGAIGQFAETYTTKTADPAGAREKVIEDLITSLVDRSEREHSAVISLGGAVGVLGGVRLNADGYQLAMPVHLTLGLGLQCYHAHTGGFHASIDAFDLGQYVTYSSNTLDVAAPDLKSSVIAGGTVGYWFAARETPMFAAVHGSVSPFVRTTDGKVTYTLGLMLGIYVPLLDFN